MNKVVVLPVGSTEQHGHHLPIDVDAKLASRVADEAGRRSPADMLILPTVAYGYTHHVMDFPGTINIEPSTFVRFLLDITKSVAYHGFKRIIIVNGHGSNHPLVEQAGRQTILQTDALCLTLSWWQLVAERWNKEIRTSVIPGGCAHACELETSMYMHVDGSQVRADRIKGKPADYLSLPGASTWHSTDLTASNGPVSLIEWTSSYTETGSFGEPEKATPEKGRVVFEHAVTRFVDLVRWFRERPAPPRRPRQQAAHASEVRFGF
jgi:creatinine amidohydrolase